MTHDSVQDLVVIDARPVGFNSILGYPLTMEFFPTSELIAIDRRRPKSVYRIRTRPALAVGSSSRRSPCGFREFVGATDSGSGHQPVANSVPNTQPIAVFGAHAKRVATREVCLAEAAQPRRRTTYFAVRRRTAPVMEGIV